MEISAKFQEIAEEELGIARQERQERLGESNVMLCDESHAKPVGRNLGHEQDIVNTLFLRKKAFIGLR